MKKAILTSLCCVLLGYVPVTIIYFSFKFVEYSRYCGHLHFGIKNTDENRFFSQFSYKNANNFFSAAHIQIVFITYLVPLLLNIPCEFETNI